MRPEAEPSYAVDRTLDEALRELGAHDSRSSWLKTARTQLVKRFVTPDWFDREHNRHWLSQSEVQTDLKRLARARSAGRTPDETVLRSLQDRLGALSAEDRQHTEAVVSSVLAFLGERAMPPSGGAALSAIQTLGAETSAQIQELEKRLESTLPPVSASQTSTFVRIADEQLRTSINAVLRRRAGMEDTELADELHLLLAECAGPGHLAIASPVAKVYLMNWIARAEAGSGRIDQALGMVERIRAEGGTPDDITLASADGAQGLHERALRRLRDLDTPDARSVALSILSKAQGDAAAYAHLEAGGLDDARRFSPIGWRNVCVILTRQYRLKQVRELADVLTPSLTDECAELLELLGLAYVAELIPPDRHKELLEAHPVMLAHGRLDTPTARTASRRAVDLFTRAAEVASAQASHRTAKRCDKWLVALRLSDADLRASEIERLREAVGEMAQAVALVQFVGAFQLDIDMMPLERYLEVRRQLGGWDDQELSAWLWLLQLGDRDDELIDLIEAQWATLAQTLAPSPLAQVLLTSLLNKGRVARAQEWLDAHKHQIDDNDVARLSMMLVERRGDDPTVEARTLYEQTGALVDLHNLVFALGRASHWHELVPYAQLLFNREPTHDNVRVCLHAMAKAGSSPQAKLDFLQLAEVKVEPTSNLAAEKAWTLLALGRAREAQELLHGLEAVRDDPRDVALDLNLSLQIGDWNRFPSLIERAMRHRDALPPESLLSISRIAGLHSPERAVDLASEAVEREPTNIGILISAYQLAVSVGRDEAGRPWFRRALSLPRQGDSLRAMSVRELLELQEEEWRTRTDKLAMLRKAEVPLHMAAALFNAPLTRFLHVIPRMNADRRDGRQREGIPIRAGARLPVPCIDAQSIALDISSVLVLAELGLLQAVLDSFAQVWISARLMGTLLEERRRLKFHQPSLVNAAKPLLGLVASGKLSVVREQGSAKLAKVIGVADAALLHAAEKIGGVLVHPGALLDLQQYMERPAVLGEHARFVVGLRDITHTLRTLAHITPAQEIAANNHFEHIEPVVRAEQDDRPALRLAHVFLDPHAARALEQTGLLATLLQVASSVSVHETAATEWTELVATEFANAPTISAIENSRALLFQAWESGTLQFLAPVRDDEDERFNGASACLADVLHGAGIAEVVCIDDRMLTAHLTLTEKSGRSLPLVTTFDLVDRLTHMQALSDAQRMEVLHQARRRQMYCVPLTEGDLQAMLTEATVLDDGTLQETAMLRTLREHLAMLFGADMLCTPGDQVYQDGLWLCGAKTTQALWSNQALDAHVAKAKAGWILQNVMPTVHDQMRHSDEGTERWLEVAAARASLGCIPWVGSKGRQAEQRRWLDSAQLRPFRSVNSGVLDEVATRIGKILVDQAGAIVGVTPLSMPRILRYLLGLLPTALLDRVLAKSDVVEAAGLLRARVEGLGDVDFNEVRTAALAIVGDVTSAPLKSNLAGSTPLSIASTDHGLVLSDQNGSSASLGPLALLDPDLRRRQQAYAALAARALPAFLQEEQWRNLVNERGFTGGEVTRFMDDLNNCAEHRLASIDATLKKKSIGPDDFIPESRTYYESLIGPAVEGQSPSAYLNETFNVHVRAVVARDRAWGWKLARSAFVGRSSNIVEVLQGIPDEDLLALLEGSAPESSPYATVADLAVSLARMPNDPRFRERIHAQLDRLKLVATSEGAGQGSTRLWSALFELVFCKISVNAETCAAPPYWRRLAAFVHAHMVFEVLSIPSQEFDDFAQWCDSQHDHAMAATSFVDHHQEPLHDVWGDYSGAAELKALGHAMRLVADARSAGFFSEEWLPEDGHGEIASRCMIAQLLGDAPDILSSARDALDSTERSNLDAASVQAILSRIAEERHNLATWHLVAHLSRAARFDAELLGALRLRVAQDIQEATDVASSLAIAAKAASIASAQTDPVMADAVAEHLLLRCRQAVSNDEIWLAWAVLMVAAAAQSDHKAWQSWLTRRLTHLAYAVPHGPACGALAQSLASVEELLPIGEQVAGSAAAVARAGAL